MKKILSALLSIIIVVTTCLALPVSSFAAVSTTTINLATKYQTMNGFGASACWWAKDVGDWENLDDITALLYDEEKGIGLNIFRYNLGTGSVNDTVNYGDRATETFINPDCETYDWSRDANAQNVIASARKYAGDDMRVTLFCNSAPIYMTRNGHATGNYYWWDVCNLDTDNNSRLFADYGYECVNYFQNQGYRVTDISPVNEPYGHWCQYPVVDENGNSVLDENGNEIPNGYAGQEGCTCYEADVLKIDNAFITKFKGSQAEENGCRVSTLEANDMANNDGKLASFLNVLIGTGSDVYSKNRTIRNYLDTITMHSYFSTREAKLETAKLMKDTYGDKYKVAQTEYCQMDIDSTNGLAELYKQEGMTSGLGIDYGIALADVMYDDLTIFNAVEWDWWTACAFGGYTDGLVYLNKQTHEIETSKRLYTMGNFSKFTDEGSVRIGASSGNSAIKTIAFSNPDGTISVVFINDSKSAQQTNLSVKGISSDCISFKTYVTDKTRDLAEYQSSNSASTITLPARSVTTAVINTEKTAHSYKNIITPATLSKNGTAVPTCSLCGATKTATTIYYPKTIALSATVYNYDGKVKTPAVTVKDAKGKTLVKNTDYTVTYASGRKLVGKYAVKLTFKGKYSGTKTLYFTIRPKNTTFSLASGKKAFTAKIKKYTTQTTGYQIQYATNSKFTSAKTVAMKNTTTSKTISKLAGGKKYYVRIRTYKTVKINGKNTNIYSAWSSAKYITTKK